MLKSIKKSMEDFHNLRRVVHAARKGQKITTVDTTEGRVYEITINR